MASRPFVVPVARLRRAIGTRRHERREGTIDDLECSGSAVPPGGLLVADVNIESAVGGVAVTGTVLAPWEGACRRCLEPAAGVLEVPVRELYTQDGDGEETYPLVDDELDLEPLVHDAVLLELPQAPLCRPDCVGLCAVCGANRNAEPCTCTAPRDPRWAALDMLRSGDPAPDRVSDHAPDPVSDAEPDPVPEGVPGDPSREQAHEHRSGPGGTRRRTG